MASSVHSSASRLGAFAPLLIFVLLFAALSIFVPDFFGLRNMRGLVLSVTLVGTIATTMMLVLALREVDLSVGSITALSGVVCAVVIASDRQRRARCRRRAGGGPRRRRSSTASIVARLKVNSLIVTLAMMEIVRGLAFLASSGEAVSIPAERFYELGSGTFLGINYPIWIMIACFAAVRRGAQSHGVRPQHPGDRRQSRGRAPGRRAGRPGAHHRLRAAGADRRARRHRARGAHHQRPAQYQPRAGARRDLRLRAGRRVAGGRRRARSAASIVGVLIMGAAQNALNLLDVPDLLPICRPRRHPARRGDLRPAAPDRAAAAALRLRGARPAPPPTKATPA